ncbi:pentatricopeptide repeat-containing protein At1g69290 [Cucurbita moschata]|uniref:Pentatricopeptide repeat-containing protein At1g69290 n=1 Tax=Cucurbita moschata TaxID=3662 RepID=A0A6J1G2B5_CUCMO|nr:pentatricopeptide repeat-containing protein At1g69290 [Cucurbita moschata]
MWKRAVCSIPRRLFSSTPEVSSLYSFLQPSLFAPKRAPFSPSQESTDLRQNQTPQILTTDRVAAVETTLHKSLLTSDTDEAWKSFKLLTKSSVFPCKSLTNSLIAHLSSIGGVHNLKRAFASAVFVIEKKPELLDFGSVKTLLASMKCANTAAPAVSLIKCMLRNRCFVPFEFWGNELVSICRQSGSLIPFLRVFEEICRIVLNERLDSMKPDLNACNAALEGCCHELESVTDAEHVVETMSLLNLRPDEVTFGALAHLYALKGLEQKIIELKRLMGSFGFASKSLFFNNLVSGYVNSGDLAAVSKTMLDGLKDECGEHVRFEEKTYLEVVKAFVQSGNLKELSSLIVDAQNLESLTDVDGSIGFGIINACVNIGWLDNVHAILKEINSQGVSVGLGVYMPILKAYQKERRTAEATQLIMDVSSSGLQLVAETFDALIEASMSNQDFQSAFALFRKMRETRKSNTNASYLTIMTGLMESHRPELMAAFLDEVVEDPLVEVGTHDWNSIIHAFCKAGRLEDARRTFRRMKFLQFEPNEQTFLSLINGYVSGERYFCVLMLWNELKWKITANGERGFKLDSNLVDAFLYALVKGGFFDAVMQVVEKTKDSKTFVDKWKYKQAFMETHKKLKVAKLRRRNHRKMQSLIDFKNWVGLNA